MKIEKIKVYDIKWDKDADDDTELPDEMTVFVSAGENDDKEELISDYLSDKCGYCHNGFKYETIP